ncbi:MAG: carboxypeptidase-like regulatory domain-containing protein [Chitinispirillales bacterium]|jgi:hypothetical protein|nr:carboxypeptidase-like regulatory domain-containing protein [Chitinispirillales bacterium]
MLRKIEIAVLLVLACCAFALAAQHQVLKIVPDPAALGVKSGGDTIRIEWVRLTAPGSQDLVAIPDSAGIYLSRTPAAGDLSRYRRVTAPIRGRDNVLIPFFGDETMRMRYTDFVPNNQTGLLPGTYYGIVAAYTGGDTLFSDYFTLMIESTVPPSMIYPKGDFMTERVRRIDELTPLFRWSRVDGVPYYHVVLSDEPIIDMETLNPSEHISVIWQAITPNNSIAYGAPDPSGTITASPPPLTPGKTYSWLVLNNYGNHMAFSSAMINPMDAVFGSFVIDGTPMAAPRVVGPRPGSAFNYVAAPQIEFSWTGLDTRANSYLINVFSTAGGHDLGIDGLGELKAGLLIWEQTVSRGNLGARDTMRVSFDAAGTLAGGDYTWRVYAVDSRGAASTDTLSVSNFTYSANAGTVSLATVERLGGRAMPVGFVELRTEVISGPTQAPLAFFTDPNGISVRPFPVGTYRFTAMKEGYSTQVITTSVALGRTVTDTIFMASPDAILFGRVLAESDGTPVNMVRVTAVSEWGDTVSAFTDGNGAFTLSCGAAAWTVHIEKAGYRSVTPRRVNLRVGDNRDFGAVNLVRNPFALSGVVRNSEGSPIIGARVRVLREGVLVEELPSTPQSGAYVFYLTSGTYTLTADKAGFTPFSREIHVTGSRAQDVTIREGAMLVNGSVVGRSWVPEMNAYVNAPVTSARISLIAPSLTVEGRIDTLTAVSDAVFGRFSINVPDTDRAYSVVIEAAGFDLESSDRPDFVTEEGVLPSFIFTDTLYAFAMIRGVVTSLETGLRLSGVDVQVRDADGNVVASGRSSVNGSFEVRNIPDGNFAVGAGRSGYYTLDSYNIEIANGRPAENVVSYDFEMGIGNRVIVWNVIGYDGRGQIKVVSPLNRAVDFDYTSAIPLVARLEGVGPGRYTIEAVSETNPNLLELSRYRFDVEAGENGDSGEEEDGDEPEPTVVDVDFPFLHNIVEIGSSGVGTVRLGVAAIRELRASVESVELFYRSEGSTRFESVERNDGGYIFDIEPRRDGTNLFYYFRVRLSNGAVYGSDKQIFVVHVPPAEGLITRLVVEPGASDGDVLSLPSSYTARFGFRAFYSDMFIGIDGPVGTVRWSVYDEGGVVIEELEVASTAVFEYTTPQDAQNLTLRAVLTPSSGYAMRSGRDNTVEFPIRVTGSALESMSVSRRGNAGPVSSTENASFRIDARDGAGNNISVSPAWGVVPAGAGAVSVDGVFTPNAAFFGNVRIIATIGSVSAEYTEHGVPGQDVYFTLRHRNEGSDTVFTLRGFRLVLPAGSVDVGETSDFGSYIPDLTNHLHRASTDGFRMADTIAFEMVAPTFDKIRNQVYIIIDVPAHLREAARTGDHELRIARWSDADLMWVPFSTSNISEDGATVTVALSSVSPMRKAAAVAGADAVDMLAANARYALVTRTRSLTVDVSVSPHPFSPFIIPVREHGPNAQPGTRIRVNVEAPEAFVRSIKVHIYNAAGTRVWAVDKLNAGVGSNDFWWNGRTSGGGNGRTSVKEELWVNFDNSDKPLVRNGRYFVAVIVTDLEGRQKRVMRPVVVMK